jgi:predicted nucleotidyltransferase
MTLNAAYPTAQHSDAASVITAFFAHNYDIESVLLLNSCARGKATRDSCLDIAVLARPEWLLGHEKRLETDWAAFEDHDATIRALKLTGRFSQVHLALINGVFTPTEQDEASGPDAFEVGIGNFLAYSVPLWERHTRSTYFDELKEAWLPYYDEGLRRKRLEAVRWFCLNNLAHIPLYLERGLYFQSFDRLYNAYQEFLQALFISRRTYPIAYNKWIHEQIVEILKMPELYAQLPRLFEIRDFESSELIQKAHEIERLLDEYAPAQGAVT